jgi:hypothetical protein
VKAIYPDNGDTDPDAVPGVRPETEGAADARPLMLDVDGEVFALSPNESDGTDYTWLSGKNPGYGFGVSPTPNLSLDEHRKNIRDFLAVVDPTTGYIEDE